MKEKFLAYAKTGAMTKEQLAEVLNLKPFAVWRMAKDGKIPRIPGLHFYRFDPLAMIDLFCGAQGDKPRSLTIERHKTGAKTSGGYRKCL